MSIILRLAVDQDPHAGGIILKATFAMALRVARWTYKTYRGDTFPNIGNVVDKEVPRLVFHGFLDVIRGAANGNSTKLLRGKPAKSSF